MEITLSCTCEVVERQELLNGTETLTIEGTSEDGWTITGTIVSNRGLVDFPGEGDLTAARDADGAEVYATLTRAEFAPAGDDAQVFRLEYEVEGGAGAFEGVAGAAEAAGTLAGTSIEGRWTLRLRDLP